MNILSLVKAHIQEHRQVSLYDLSVQFGREPDILRDMLERWIDKGIIEKKMQTPHCGSLCNRCHPSIVEIYVWCGEKDKLTHS